MTIEARLDDTNYTKPMDFWAEKSASNNRARGSARAMMPCFWRHLPIRLWVAILPNWAWGGVASLCLQRVAGCGVTGLDIDADMVALAGQNNAEPMIWA